MEIDLEILNRKVSTYRDSAGRVRQVSDELLLEILVAWEHWTGPASGFYTALGVSSKGIASLIKKAKQLKREGFPSGDFKEVRIEGGGGGVVPMSSSGPCSGIELCWSEGRVIRFPQVDQLLEFLKKAA
jgi:hypothetical protein